MVGSIYKEKKSMTNEVASPGTEVTCANCEACCCRQVAMLFNDTEVPDNLIEINTQGERSMMRLADGWCKALDRNTMTCSIYEKRPWICREFEMGACECISARAASM